MPLFDWCAIVDWSGGNGRRALKPDAIWIAHGPFTADQPTIDAPPSRAEAEGLLKGLLQEFASPTATTRALVCFDFAYGYPSGFSRCLPCAEGVAPWRSVWDYLSENLGDDLGTKPGGRPSNRSNRFELANRINLEMSGHQTVGPFWCLYAAGTQPFVPQRQPGQPFRDKFGREVAARRITDRRVAADTVFRLFGTGSVGSQALTGIPRVRSLRDDSELSSVSKVWPFETGWASTSTWLTGVRIVHAEIYPSVREPLEDAIKDRGQVRAMWAWARDESRAERLPQAFEIPEGIMRGSEDEQRILSEEGWILGTL